MQTDTKARTETVGGEPRPHATRTVIAASVAFGVLVMAVAIGVIVARPDRGGEDGTPSPMATSAGPSATAPHTTDAHGGGGAPTAPPKTSPPAKPVLEDGHHPVYLTDINVASRSVKFDLIQFLTGDEAVAAYHRDHPDEPDGPPDGFYIINDNPKLRRLPVADDVTVTVLDWNAGFQPKVVAFADLPAELAARGIPGKNLGANPFWLTVDDGTITAIEEQYLP